MGTPAPGQAITGQPVVVTNAPQLGTAIGFPFIGKVGASGGLNDNTSNATAFWNAAVLGANALSPSVNIGGYGKVRIFTNSSVADTFNVQFSPDGGTTWYTLTQDNAGTPLIIATTATQLTSCRDIATFGAGSVRLLNITAATVTAGFQAETF